MRTYIIVLAFLFTFSLSNASIIDFLKSKKDKKEEKKDDQKDTKKVSDNNKQKKVDVKSPPSNDNLKKKDVKKQEAKKTKVQAAKSKIKNKVKKTNNALKVKVQKKTEAGKKPSNNTPTKNNKVSPSKNPSKKADNKSIKPNNKNSNNKPDNKVKANSNPNNKKPDIKVKPSSKPDNKVKPNSKPDNKNKPNTKPDSKKPDKINPNKPKPANIKPNSNKPSAPLPPETRKVRNDTKYGDSKQSPVSGNIKPRPVPSSSAIPSSGLAVGPRLAPIGNGIVSKNEPKTQKVNTMGIDFLFGGGNFISKDLSKQNADYSLPEPYQYSLNLGIAPYQVIHGAFRVRSLIHWEGQNLGDYTLGQVLIGAGPQYALPSLPMLKSLPFEASIGTRGGIAIGYSIVWNNGSRDMNFLKASLSPFIEPYATIKTKFSKTMGIGTELSYIMPMGGKSYKIESNGHSYEIKNKDLGCQSKHYAVLQPRDLTGA